jgi:Aerotolerance regulator N-terminal/von Willebrand factor type A domain
MFLFNLSLPELLGLVGLGSAVVVALYMLDRSRRTIVVSTLKFWKGTERQVEAARRKRVQQWPSLLMQLLAIALLLLAIAQLRLGSRDTTSLDHVLLVDTSAWMAAQPAGQPVLMEQARTAALNYIAALAGTDRVMVVYADGLATPVTAFESSRVKAREAVMRARASASSLHLADAVRFAQQAQRNAKRPGEIVLAGGARPAADSQLDTYPKNFRLLETQGEAENIGIRRIGLRPADDAPNVWHVLVSVANYSDRPRTANLGLTFGGTPATSRNLTVPARGSAEVAFNYSTGASGILEARLSPDGRDDLKSDNVASVELPGLKTVAITVCSDQPRLLQPVFDSLPSVAPKFRTLADCKSGALTGLAVYEGMAPVGTALNSIVITAPSGESKVPILTTARATKFAGWRPDHPLTVGLRSENETIDGTQIFAPGANDLVIAQTAAGPVAVVHTEPSSRQLYLGFHPLRSSFRYEVTAPLFFANALKWLAPEAFNRHEIIAAGVGATMTRVDADAPVKVLDEKGQALPFSRQGGDVRFFTPLMGRVRVVEGAPGASTAALAANEQVFSMALPDVPEKTWEKPTTVLRGIPRPRGALSGGNDIWYWLVLAAAALLLADWMLFAPGVRRMAASMPAIFRRAA